MPAELARADPQHGVAELRQEGGALLLPFPLLSLREQFHDQRALAANVGDDERTDLAARAEAMRMQGARLQQQTQPLFEHAMRLGPRSARPAEKGGEHVRRLALRGWDAGGDYLGGMPRKISASRGAK